jgi:hypothetical protein
VNVQSDDLGFHLPTQWKELVDRRMAANQRELRELLIETLAASAGAEDADLKALEEACTSRTTGVDASGWVLAALAFEDRAVQLAEAWLDDPDLAPGRRERVIALLTEAPGYWQLRGLGDDLAEQVIAPSTRPRTLSATLGFVLGMLALVDHPEEQERILG